MKLEKINNNIGLDGFLEKARTDKLVSDPGTSRLIWSTSRRLKAINGSCYYYMKKIFTKYYEYKAKKSLFIQGVSPFVHSMSDH
jgi:hypothetical protein